MNLLIWSQIKGGVTSHDHQSRPPNALTLPKTAYKWPTNCRKQGAYAAFSPVVILYCILKTTGLYIIIDQL